ncbi:type 1 glutamine amidotransferase [Desulfomicrobium norvegicum]|uniref:type 1 glutamine amidotransferase n=1 Tax=Desulfomicrobium norvegicum (strain DSM 1741 / NCIMB 8310) TaxID=52561 RepID=UPI0031343447
MISRVALHECPHTATCFFEGIGSIDKWLNQRNANVSYSRFYESNDLPALSEIDIVIIMGGPMSVHDESEFPWLVEEKRFLREAISAGIPILGICLGAQLLASALGAKIYKNSQKEIGWFDITKVPNPGFQFPDTIKVFHWHGETFTLPPGAVHLARSAACEQQAFQYGENIIGLQFHLETTQETINSLIKNCNDELISDIYIQPETSIKYEKIENFGKINNLMSLILNYITKINSYKS